MLILDAVLGVRKASIGIREGRIHAVGRAGNPDTLDGVEVVVGTGTTIVSGEGLIATAGAIDTHVHLLSPRIMEASLASGVTTVIGQEFGPVWGVGVNSPWALRHAFNAFDAWPVNIGFLARGSSSHPAPLVEALAEGGACGFKVHEDLGAHARALDTALRVAEEYDVQVALHTDGLNEAWLRRGHPRRARRPHHPRLPHRGLRRRARPERAAPGRPGERHRLLDQPDPALRPGRARRALRHDRARCTPSSPTCPATPPWPGTGSAPARWAPRTCCTTSASSRSPPPTPKAWAAPGRRYAGPSPWPTR